MKVKSDFITSLATVKNRLKTNAKVTPMHPLPLFHRICILQEGEGELHSYLCYELALYPFSLFNEEGMRKSSKAVLYEKFEECKNVVLNTDFHYIIDGGYLLHKVIWPPRSNFGDVIQSYYKFVEKHFGKIVSLVFDGYSESVKDAERRRRYIYSTLDIVFDDNIPVTIKQELFLCLIKQDSSTH